LTEVQIGRQVLLAGFETYLVKQRGPSPCRLCPIPRIADRFLDHRFGAEIKDPGGLHPGDAIAFLKHFLTCKHRLIRGVFRFLSNTSAWRRQQQASDEPEP